MYPIDKMVFDEQENLVNVQPIQDNYLESIDLNIKLMKEFLDNFKKKVSEDSCYQGYSLTLTRARDAFLKSFN